MFQVHDVFTLNVKRNSKTIRNILTAFCGLSFLLGSFYSLYWGLALNDGIVVELTQKYFSPLVGVFFEDTTSLDNYLMTGLYMFLACIPICILHYLAQKTEETMLTLHEKTLESKKRKERIQIEKAKEQEYTNINSYSICLSLDFSQNKNLNPSFKEKLNNYIVKTLNKELSKISDNIQIINKKAILIHSKDFYSYDKVYSTVLKELANVKSLLASNISFTPTITTDAYTTEFNPEKTIKQHYDIVRCNLAGRATTTATFSKKYTHLAQNKYQGTPIGLYTTFENQNYKEYDLNVVHKNLNMTLSSLC